MNKKNPLAFKVVLLKYAIFGFSSKSSYNSENKCLEKKKVLLFTAPSLLQPLFTKNGSIAVIIKIFTGKNDCDIKNEALILFLKRLNIVCK